MKVTFFNVTDQFAVDRIPMATWSESVYLPRTGEYLQMHHSTWKVHSVVWTDSLNVEVEIYLSKMNFDL